MGKVMYIVSDLHGCGEVYDSIIEYLEQKKGQSFILMVI